MNLQTVRRLQKNVHRLPYPVEVSLYIRILISTASFSLILRLSALLLPTYLTIFQLCYCLHISPIFQLCYCVLISPIFQLCYCVFNSQILQAPPHNLHMLYIFLFL